MNTRLSLALIILLLLGGGFYLWMKPSPTNTPEAIHAPSQDQAANYVLAISWQPAFCETHADKPECRNEPARHASQFTLHGLWPDDEYCGVTSADRASDKSGDWFALPAPKLASATRQALEAAMPGTRSGLERHEWIKHGTCAKVPAETYFAAALAVLSDINASSMPKLFAANLGASLTLSDIRNAFDQAYGRGAGKRIRLSCTSDGQRRLLTEITIGLHGAPTSDTPLKSLIAAARPTDGGCSGGVVDPLGNQ